MAAVVMVNLVILALVVVIALEMLLDLVPEDPPGMEAQ
jgi:hypothetical protein